MPIFSRRSRVSWSSFSADSSTSSTLTDAGRRAVQPAYKLQQCRFSRAGRTHDRHALALLDRQVQRMERLHHTGAVAFGDVGQLDHRRSREYPDMGSQSRKRGLILPQGRGTAKMIFPGGRGGKGLYLTGLAQVIAARRGAQGAARNSIAVSSQRNYDDGRPQQA